MILFFVLDDLAAVSFFFCLSLYLSAVVCKCVCMRVYALVWQWVA